MILEMIDICKEYKQGEMSVPVLKNVNFSMKEGEYVSIMGPSGSGKSTFLRCLNLLEQPTGGEIWFEGNNITDKKDNDHYKKNNYIDALFTCVHINFHFLVFTF